MLKFLVKMFYIVTLQFNKIGSMNERERLEKELEDFEKVRCYLITPRRFVDKKRFKKILNKILGKNFEHTSHELLGIVLSDTNNVEEFIESLQDTESIHTLIYTTSDLIKTSEKFNEEIKVIGSGDYGVLPALVKFLNEYVSRTWVEGNVTNFCAECGHPVTIQLDWSDTPRCYYCNDPDIKYGIELYGDISDNLIEVYLDLKRLRKEQPDIDVKVAVKLMKKRYDTNRRLVDPDGSEIIRDLTEQSLLDSEEDEEPFNPCEDCGGECDDCPHNE